MEITTPVYGLEGSEFWGRACSEALGWSCVVCFIAARAEIETIYSCRISTKINTVSPNKEIISCSIDRFLQKYAAFFLGVH